MDSDGGYRNTFCPRYDHSTTTKQCEAACDNYLRSRKEEFAAVQDRLFKEKREAYAQRDKTLIETVLNYSTIALVDGTHEYYWVAGYQGDKCAAVMTLKNDVPRKPTIKLVDIKKFNRAGFRYSQKEFGDEKTTVLVRASPPPLMDRMGKAWELAFRECPPKSSAF